MQVMNYCLLRFEKSLKPVFGELNSVHSHGKLHLTTLLPCRGKRGFSSLPINLVFEHFVHNLTSKYTTEDKLEDAEKTAENLYLAILAITGFCAEFPYALEILRTYEITSPYPERLDPFLPLRGKER